VKSVAALSVVTRLLVAKARIAFAGARFWLQGALEEEEKRSLARGEEKS